MLKHFVSRTLLIFQLLCWGAISILHSGCAADSAEPVSDPQPTAADQPKSESFQYVFDCYHENHAWGHQLNGFMVDGQGNVYRYNRKGQAWQPQLQQDGKSIYYSSADLAEKFAQKSLVAHLDSDTLNTKMSLIAQAANGASSDLLNQHIADAGQNRCVAYQQVADGYMPIQLGSFGISQNRITNSAPAAQELLKWLTEEVAKLLGRS